MLWRDVGKISWEDGYINVCAVVNGKFRFFFRFLRVFVEKLFFSGIEKEVDNFGILGSLKSRGGDRTGVYLLFFFYVFVLSFGFRCVLGRGGR